MAPDTHETIADQGNAADEVAENSGMVRRFVSVNQIDDSDRLRPVDSVVAEGIAASIAQVGLLNPIIVCKMINQKSGRLYRLVAGGHRLTAIRELGWDNVEVAICSANALERRSIEIAENFFRAEMSPLDQARFVTELIENEKARRGIGSDQDGRALNADVRSEKYTNKQAADDVRNLRKSLGLQEAVAARLGLNRQEVSRKMALNGIDRSYLDRIRRLPIADNANALRKLAGQNGQRQPVIIGLLEDGLAKDVATAIRIVETAESKPKLGLAGAVKIINGRAPETPESKRKGALLSAWDRMAAVERKVVLRELSKKMTAAERAYMVEEFAASDVKEAAE